MCRPPRVWRWLVGAGVCSLPVLWVGPAAAQRPRLNPLISSLEQGRPALSGAEWLFIDMEHGPYLLDRLQTTLEDLGKKRTATGQFTKAPSCLSEKVACAYPVLGSENELKRRTTEGFKVLLVAGRPARP